MKETMIRNLDRIALLVLSLSCRSKLKPKSPIVHNYSCFLNVLLLLFLNAGFSRSTKVLQDPASVFWSPSATISCSHSVSSYDVILWYQQLKGEPALKLIGYVLSKSPTVEDEFQQHFNVTGDGSVKSQLQVLKVQELDVSGMYYCAAS